jgi:hypothetical protein
VSGGGGGGKGREGLGGGQRGDREGGNLIRVNSAYENSA